MKYAINLFVMAFVAWPALAVGYVYEAVSLGLFAGRAMFNQHSDKVFDRFVPKEKGGE